MLDNVIDINYYAVPQAENSNFKHRPIGMGIMGFQDALYIKKIPYASEAAVDFADESMELVSYMAINASSDLAKERVLTLHMRVLFGVKEYCHLTQLKFLKNKEEKTTSKLIRQLVLTGTLLEKSQNSGDEKLKHYGNSTTATIANITGLTQSIEPTYSNLFVKSNLLWRVYCHKHAFS